MAKDKIEIEVLAKGLEKVQKDLTKLTKQGTKMKGGFTALKAGAVAFAAVMTGKVINALRQVTKEAAKFLQGMEAMEKRFGVSADKVLKKLREVAKGTISDTDLMAAANRAMTLGVTQDMDKLAQALEVARASAKNMGLDSTQAFNDMITGIGRKSPLILDNLGLIIKGFEAQSKATGGTGSATELLNKVLEENLAISRKINDGQLTFAERLEQTASTAENIKIQFGIGIVTALSDAIGRFEDLGIEMEVINKTARKMGQIVGAVVEILANSARIIVNAFKATIAPITSVLEAYELIKDFKFGDAAQKFKEEWTGALKDSFKSMKGSVANIKDAIAGLFKDVPPKAGPPAREAGKEVGKVLGKSMLDEFSKHMNVMGSLTQSAFDVITDASTMKTDAIISDLERERDAKIKAVQDEKNVIDAIEEEEKASKIARLEEIKNAAMVAGNAQKENEIQNEIDRLNFIDDSKAKEDAINASFNKKIAKQKTKVAKAEKVAAIFGIQLNAAQAVMRLFKDFPAPIAGALTAVVGGIQTAQTAIAASQPIPKFKDGTGFSPGGSAIVGEAGPEVVKLPQGSRVIPNSEINNVTNDGRIININVQANNGVELVNDLRQTYGLDAFGEA